MKVINGHTIIHFFHDDGNSEYTTGGKVYTLKIYNYPLTQAQAGNALYTYSVGYNGNGGTAPSDTAMYEHNGVVTIPSTAPQRTGYTFKGWKNSANGITYLSGMSFNITSNVTLTAVWEPVTYSLSYKGVNDAMFEGQNPSEATFDTVFSVYSPTREGFNFLGWTTNSSNLDTSTARWGTTASPNNTLLDNSQRCYNGTNKVYFKNLASINHGSIALQANWQLISYGISLDGTNEASIDKTTAYYTSAIHTTISPNPGYRLPNDITITMGSEPFDNYTYDNQTGVVSIASYEATGDIVIDADCTPITYNVSYDDNSATQSHSGGDNTYNIKSTKFFLPIPPEKTNYTFGGWKVTTEAQGGTGFKLFDLISTTSRDLVSCYGDVMLTAQWNTIAPTITTSTIPSGLYGSYYDYSLEATGTPPFTWELAEGSSLVSGLSLSSDGTISGTIAFADLVSGLPNEPAEYNFTVKVTGGGSQSTTKRFAINVQSRIITISLSSNNPQAGVTLNTTNLLPTSATASYQWYTNTLATTSDGIEIVGATSSSYTPTVEDAGKYIYVVATGTGDYIGEMASVTANTVTAPLTNLSLSSNNPQAGVTLNTINLIPTSATASYQWYTNTLATTSDGIEIIGATSSSYTPTVEDAGKYIYVVATGTGDYTGEVAVVATGKVTIPVSSVNLSTDSPIVNEVITVSLLPENATVSYQWQADGIDIPGATENQYIPVNADYGKTISLTITGIDNYSGSASSETKDSVILSAILVPYAEFKKGRAPSNVRFIIGEGIPADDIGVAYFTELKIDGNVVQTSNRTFTIEDGSLVIKFRSAYLNKLSVGDHTLEVSFSGPYGGTYSTNITVLPASGSNHPATGDNNNLYFWIALMMLSLTTFTTTVYARKNTDEISN